MTHEMPDGRARFSLTHDLPPAQARAARRNVLFVIVTLVLSGGLVVLFGVEARLSGG